MGIDHDHEQEHEHEHEGTATGVANPAVIDLFGFDQKTGEVLLAMNESRPWDGSDERLHELQEKFNAYVSFLLDGEMIAAHPELANGCTSSRRSSTLTSRSFWTAK